MNNEIKQSLAKKVPIYFIVFYIVGLILFTVPFTRELFISITSFTLLLVIGIVFFFHKQWNKKTIWVFGVIILLSFLLEMVGVSTGKPFGNYHYDNGLGLKILNTPIIIGLNWLFLVYASQSIASKISKNSILKVFIGSLLMVIYDILMEWAAPIMNMWYFASTYPPLANFVTWFLAAITFHTLLVTRKINVESITARSLFWIQMIFFILIVFFESF
ncbi:MAG: carotenoid biosynthesis protein [Paludibacter sp.]